MTLKLNLQILAFNIEKSYKKLPFPLTRHCNGPVSMFFASRPTGLNTKE
jgi:hypothetical protein